MLPRLPAFASSSVKISTAATARTPRYRRRTAPDWITPAHWAPASPTSRAGVVHARSAATVLPRQARAHPSEAGSRLLTGLSGTRSITLTLASLSNKIPQTGLQSRATTGITQATTGELFGLCSIALGQANLSQAVQHLRFTRSNTLSTLQAGSSTIQITTTLLLLSRSQQSQNRTIQLLIHGQTAAWNATRRRRGITALSSCWRRSTPRLRGDASIQGSITGRERLDRRGTTATTRHHHYHAGVFRQGLRLCNWSTIAARRT